MAAQNLGSYDPLMLNGMTARDFDIVEYLSQYPKEVLGCSQGRIAATRDNPLLFAILYLSHKTTLFDENGKPKVSFAQVHLDWCRLALTLMVKNSPLEPDENHHAVIAPRETGKSTWWFGIIPLWAAAHKHISFIAAFSGTDQQVTKHLEAFKRELDTNAALQRDYPLLCDVRMSKQTGKPVMDNAHFTSRNNGFSFSALGLGSSVVGLKDGDNRPDMILLDDIEPGEKFYSASEAMKNLITVRDDILPLGRTAHVLWAGYTTMVDSLVHQMVRSAKNSEDTADWIKGMSFQVHYQPPVITDMELGTRESFWPDRYPLENLDKQRAEDPYKYHKNIENDPLDNSGSWWRKEDIERARLAEGKPAPELYDRLILVVDGAVTTKTTSDFTGIALVGLDVAQRRFYVLEAFGVKQSGDQLRSTCLELIEQHGVHYMLVETNQGGDMWHIVFHDMGVPVTSIHNKLKKEFRIKQLQFTYQRDGGHVTHVKTLPQLERQELAYPHVVNDDIVDAVACGVEHLTHMLLKDIGARRSKAIVRNVSYVGRRG